MHCKNVKILDFLSDRKKSRSQNRRGFHVTYKTLEITPMKKVLETEGGLETNGLKKALHICRGHFKDYREVGLFGKFHDIYWWDSFIRGDLKSGIVSKDYQVNVPQQEHKP